MVDKVTVTADVQDAVFLCCFKYHICLYLRKKKPFKFVSPIYWDYIVLTMKIVKEQLIKPKAKFLHEQGQEYHFKIMTKFMS